jgi:hypothetical protein
VEAIVIGHHVIIKTVNCVLEGQTEGTLAAWYNPQFIWHNILHKSISQTTLQKWNFHLQANICYTLQNICAQTLPHRKRKSKAWGHEMKIQGELRRHGPLGQEERRKRMIRKHINL